MHLASAKQLCRTLPGATEDIKWGAYLVFSVGGKMFACLAAQDATGISFKAAEERFLELTDRPGIRPAPYLARAKWVHVTVGSMSDAELAALLRHAHALVLSKLPKKIQREIAHQTQTDSR